MPKPKDFSPAEGYKSDTHEYHCLSLAIKLPKGRDREATRVELREKLAAAYPEAANLILWDDAVTVDRTIRELSKAIAALERLRA